MLKSPTRIQAALVRDKRSLREFEFPEKMRSWIADEHAFQMKDSDILERIKNEFQAPYPSVRTIQDWRLQARRQWREECRAAMSATLAKAAKRAIPDTLAMMFSALQNAHEMLEEATESGNLKMRAIAQRNVGDIGEKLLNQFRGGPATGDSAVPVEILRERALAHMVASGRFDSREQAEALFDAEVSAIAEITEIQALGEGNPDPTDSE